MPQMAPMWWTTIFMLTMSMMILSMIINYFMMSKKIKFNLKKKMNSLNWKW